MPVTRNEIGGEYVFQNLFFESIKSKFFQIWSSVTGYGELNVCFEPVRVGEIFE